MNAINEKPPTRRSAGLLLHPTSLPGPYGIGDLVRRPMPGWTPWWPPARRGGRCCRWDRPATAILPINAFSAFAGNRYLISPELLVRDGLIKESDLCQCAFSRRITWTSAASSPSRRRCWREPGRISWSGAAASLRSPFEAFCVQEARWLNDFSLFSALKDAHGGANWQDWPRESDAAPDSRPPGCPPATEPRRRSASVHAVPLLPPMEGTQALRQQSRHLPHRRRTDLRRQRFGGCVGQSGAVSARRASVGRPSWPACRRTISRPPASAGAIRCTTGTP